MRFIIIILMGCLIYLPLKAQELQPDIQAKEQRIQAQKEKLKQSIRAFFVFSRPSSQKMLLLFKMPEYKRLSLLAQSVTLDAQEALWDLQQALAEEKYFLSKAKKKDPSQPF